MLSCKSSTLVDQIDALIGLIDCVENNDKWVNNLRFESKRAIAATHLLSKILFDHLNDTKHQCPFITDNTDKTVLRDLLNCIVIRGGATRDTILDDNRAINDLDCVVEIHETTQIQLNHLRKYHSTKKQQSKDCPCLLWQYYLNKFNKNNIDNILKQYERDLDEKELIEEEKDLYFKTEREMVTCEYIINSRFFMKIICNSAILRDKLSINNFFWNHNWGISINQHLMYHGVDVNGAEFDFVDQTCKHGAVKELNVDFHDLYPKQLYNAYDTNNNDEDDELIEIKIPIYPLNTLQCIFFYDFTINTILISFGDVLKPLMNSIDYNWRYKILNGNTKYYESNIIGVKDIYNKILIPPAIKIINTETGCFYFWRLIKISTKFIDDIENNIWKIDEELIQHTMNIYDDWFTDHFANDRIARYKGCIFKFLMWGIKDRLKDYQHRLKMFKILKFDKKLNAKLDKIGKFRKQWRWAIKTKLNVNDEIKQQIFDLFATYDIRIAAHAST